MAGSPVTTGGPFQMQRIEALPSKVCGKIEKIRERLCNAAPKSARRGFHASGNRILLPKALPDSGPACSISSKLAASGRVDRAAVKVARYMSKLPAICGRLV